MFYYRKLTLSVFVFLSLLGDVGAQEKSDFDFSQQVDTYERYIPSRSAQEKSGSVGITESEFEYEYQFKVMGKLPLDFSIKSQYIGLDNSTAVDLPAHLTGVTAGLETTVPFFNFNQTYLHLAVDPSFYGDNWTFHSDNFRIPSQYVIIHVLNDRWTFLAGAAVYPDYDTTVTPILGLIYKPSDKLTFDLVPTRPHVSYALTDKLTWFAEGWYYSDNEYVVTRDTSQKAVLRYTEGRLGTGVRWKINKYTDISLAGGAIFMNSLKYLDNNGKVVLKDGPYVELRAQVKI